MVLFDRRQVLKNFALSSVGVACGYPGNSVFPAAAASGCSPKTERELKEEILHILRFSAGPDCGLALVGRSGKLLQPLNIFSEVGRFSEAPGGGVIAGAKRLRDHKWGFISGQGEWLTQPQFDDASDFSEEGLAPCWGNSKWGYVDLSGALRIPLHYERAHPFHQGLAAVGIDGK